MERSEWIFESAKGQWSMLLINANECLGYLRHFEWIRFKDIDKTNSSYFHETLFWHQLLYTHSFLIFFKIQIVEYFCVFPVALAWEMSSTVLTDRSVYRRCSSVLFGYTNVHVYLPRERAWSFSHSEEKKRHFSVYKERLLVYANPSLSLSSNISIEFVSLNNCQLVIR